MKPKKLRLKKLLTINTPDVTVSYFKDFALRFYDPKNSGFCVMKLGDVILITASRRDNVTKTEYHHVIFPNGQLGWVTNPESWVYFQFEEI